VNKPPRHGAFFIHFLRFLITAHEARNRTAEAIKKDSRSMPSDPLIAIVFSALGAEAFINELAEMAQRDADMAEPGRENIDMLHQLAATLTAIEKDQLREQLQRKYLQTSRILSTQAFARGSPPFQDFKSLIQLRDALVHPRHQDMTDQAGYISPRPAVVRNLQQRGLTRTRGSRCNGTSGGMSWLDELVTPDIANWAYQAAVGIVRAVGDMLPSGQAATPGMQFMKSRITQLPAN
jgi:hypothetical protein